MLLAAASTNAEELHHDHRVLQQARLPPHLFLSPASSGWHLAPAPRYGHTADIEADSMESKYISACGDLAAAGKPHKVCLHLVLWPACLDRFDGTMDKAPSRLGQHGLQAHHQLSLPLLLLLLLLLLLMLAWGLWCHRLAQSSAEN